MGKKKKKNRRARTPLSTGTLDNLARKAMAAGKYKQARAHLKKLVRHDRPKYLPLLIEAQENLALQMIETGKPAKAREILEQNRRLDDSGRPSPAEFLLCFKEREFSRAAGLALALLAEGAPGLAAKRKHLLYDALVLAFDGLPQAPCSGLRQVVTEAGMVHQALKHLCSRQYDQALACIKPLGFTSGFAAWKIFIKALAAFYRQDDEKARLAFGKLPEGSTAARAARPYLVLLDTNGQLKAVRKKTDILALACNLAGRQDVEQVLPRAEYLWGVGRYRDSYLHLKKNLPGFPMEGDRFVRELSEFYFNSVFHIPSGNDHKYLDFLNTLAADNKVGPAEDLMIARVTALFAEITEGPEELVVESWERFLRLHAEIHGENFRLKALVYQHLGRYFGREVAEPESFFFLPHRTSRTVEVVDEQLARHYYGLSLKLDPENRDTHFALLRLYETTSQKSLANRKLDEIIALFPEDKEALYLAGTRCMERRALVKAMKYLERAHRLDPLDAKLRESLVTCYMQAGLKYARKDRMDKCRPLLARALELGEPGSDNYKLGHAWLYLRWAIFEQLNGNREEADRLLLRACDDPFESPDRELEIIYLNHLLNLRYKNQGRQATETSKRILREFRKKARPEKAQIFARAITYFIEGLNRQPAWLKAERKNVTRYVSRASKRKLSRRQAEELVSYAETCSDRRLKRIIINRFLKTNPDDLYARFIRLQQTIEFNYGHFGRRELDEMRAILAQAEEQKESELARQVQKILRDMEIVVEEFEDLADEFDDIWEEEEFLDEELADWLDDEEELADWLDDEPEPEPEPEPKPKKEKKSPPGPEQLNLFE